MQTFFEILLFLSFLALTTGLFSPKSVIRWGSKRTHGRVLSTYGLAIIVCFILIGVTACQSEQEIQKPTVAPTPTVEQMDYVARGQVIIALEIPNKLGVSGDEFKTRDNPKGEGVFVYDPRTRFRGVERYLIWLVIEDDVYPLNSPSKMLTPTLKWPREADPKVWKTTALDPYLTAEAIEIVFKRGQNR